MWIDGEQVKDKVREMTQWWCATSSSSIVVLRRMTVKLLILGLFPLKRLRSQWSLPINTVRRRSTIQYKRWPLDLKLHRPTRLLHNVYDLDNTKFWLHVLQKTCPWIPPICQPDPGFTPFSICACVVSLIHHSSGKKHIEILCARCMKPDAPIQHKIRRCQGKETQSGICFRIKSEKL